MSDHCEVKINSAQSNDTGKPFHPRAIPGSCSRYRLLDEERIRWYGLIDTQITIWFSKHKNSRHPRYIKPTPTYVPKRLQSSLARVVTPGQRINHEGEKRPSRKPSGKFCQSVSGHDRRKDSRKRRKYFHGSTKVTICTPLGNIAQSPCLLQAGSSYRMSERDERIRRPSRPYPKIEASE